MTRANARELAVHLIYAMSFTCQEPEQAVSERLNKEYYSQLSQEHYVYTQRPTGSQVQYIDLVVSGVANRSESINEMIKNYSIGWDISRISKLSKAIMQLAIFEILYVDDIPTNVAISEAVRLAKLYDGDEAGSFVNGVLGSFARGLNTEVE